MSKGIPKVPPINSTATAAYFKKLGLLGGMIGSRHPIEFFLFGLDLVRGAGAQEWRSGRTGKANQIHESGGPCGDALERGGFDGGAQYDDLGGLCIDLFLNNAKACVLEKSLDIAGEDKSGRLVV